MMSSAYSFTSPWGCCCIIYRLLAVCFKLYALGRKLEVFNFSQKRVRKGVDQVVKDMLLKLKTPDQGIQGHSMIEVKRGMCLFISGHDARKLKAHCLKLIAYSFKLITQTSPQSIAELYLLKNTWQ